MSITDLIKKDREAGTPGPWKLHDTESYDGRSTTHYQEVWSDDLDVICEEVTRAHNDGGSANMRRIARVPELEEIALAAAKYLEALKDGDPEHQWQEHDKLQALLSK